MGVAVTAVPWGIDARQVRIEVGPREGPSNLRISGLPAEAARGCRDRVLSAIRAAGVDIPSRPLLVNVTPTDLPKRDRHLDLGVALALLAALGAVPRAAVCDRLVCGELGLAGDLRAVRGGLAVAELARELALKELLLPAGAASQAAALGALPVVQISDLEQAIEYLQGDLELNPVGGAPQTADTASEVWPDLSDVHGQDAAKRVLEVAAAGGHSLLLTGPSGSGKTLLGRCLPGILPPLTPEEAVVVTKIHATAARVPPDRLVTRPPFRSPQPDITSAGLVGGGAWPKPGEVSMAHSGVLFLDELTRFRPKLLEALSQPLEEGRVELVRSQGRRVYPAQAAVVCTVRDLERFRHRNSGRMLPARLTLCAELPPVTPAEMRSTAGESSAAVAERVARARAMQRERLGETATGRVNAAMTPAEVRRFCGIDSKGCRLLAAAAERRGLSARAMHNVLTVARTVADLGGNTAIRAPHVAEALTASGTRL